MNRRTLVTIALSASLSAAVTGLVVHTVRAVGIPTTPSMFYRGTLDPAAPGTVTRTFRVALYDAATAGTPLYNTGDAMVAVTNGAFEVPLPVECTNIIRGTTPDPGIWLELTVDGTTIPTRTKLGAVPYAVEAERAVNATAATGALQTTLTTMQSQIAALTTQLNAATDANPDCPPGYRLNTLPDATILPSMRLCVRGADPLAGDPDRRDQVVRVGSGRSAFWIDRFEATVWDAPFDRVGRQLGASNDDYAPLPKNGQWRTATLSSPPLFALSRASRVPSSRITWFQANEVCRASGKRLPTGSEWLAAASGTDDPGDFPGTGGRCNTGNGSGGASPLNPRDTGLGGVGCSSAWGAQDMIGNLWEWTDEWFAGAGNTGYVNDGVSNWPTATGNDYHGDYTWNVNGFVTNGVGGIVALPSAALRGGSWEYGTRAGVFSLYLSVGPSTWSPNVGFRCVLPR